MGGRWGKRWLPLRRRPALLAASAGPGFDLGISCFVRRPISTRAIMGGTLGALGVRGSFLASAITLDGGEPVLRDGGAGLGCDSRGGRRVGR